MMITDTELAIVTLQHGKQNYVPIMQHLYKVAALVALALICSTGCTSHLASIITAMATTLLISSALVLCFMLAAYIHCSLGTSHSV